MGVWMCGWDMCGSVDGICGYVDRTCVGEWKEHVRMCMDWMYMSMWVGFTYFASV